MASFRRSLLVAIGVLCGALAAAVAAPRANESGVQGNCYYFFTTALHVDEAGVVAVPSRFKWSAETGVSGFDAQGNALPDSRVLLRLYDPDQNFTALTAQMDLATAARLHHDLGEIIVKKLEDPNFVHRPRLYDPKLIPTGRFKGIDKGGKAIVELECPQPEPVR